MSLLELRGVSGGYGPVQVLRNLDLEVVSPSGQIYPGNFFTDDLNRSGGIDAGEDCPATVYTGSASELAHALERRGEFRAEHLVEAFGCSPDEAVRVLGEHGYAGPAMSTAFTATVDTSAVWPLYVLAGTFTAARKGYFLVSLAATSAGIFRIRIWF